MTPDGGELLTRITEAMTRYECDGQVGIGMSEFLDQVVDGWPIGVPQQSLLSDTLDLHSRPPGLELNDAED